MHLSNMLFYSILYIGILVGSNCGTISNSTALSQESEIQYLIFGIDFSECGGDCAKLYKIEDRQLYEDDVNYITSFGQIIPFKDFPLSEKKYAIAKDLMTNFPPELMNSKSKVIGKPNTYDQGGITIEIKAGNEVKKWYVDTEIKRQPEFLVPYTQKIMNVINQLTEE